MSRALGEQRKLVAALAALQPSEQASDDELAQLVAERQQILDALKRLGVPEEAAGSEAAVAMAADIQKAIATGDRLMRCLEQRRRDVAAELAAAGQAGRRLSHRVVAPSTTGGRIDRKV